MLITKEVEVKIGVRNINYYKNKGYIIPQNEKMKVSRGTKILVNVDDLTDGSKAKIIIKCDNCGKIIKDVVWQNYKKCVKEDNKYYCKKCAMKLYGTNAYRKTRLQNSKSFKQWCTENNRQDILDRWDYELNDCKPSEICFGTSNKYYFKCSRNLHQSELKQISIITSYNRNVECNQCKSFEQWCLDNNYKDILDRWDYDLNDCKPNEITYGISKKFYFKCPKGIHKSELKNINGFTNGQEGSIQCKVCNSFAQWGIDNLGEDFLEKYWDYEKNTVNPWEITKCFDEHKVWIKCQEKDYHGSYLARCADFIKNNRCPYCINSHGIVHPLDSLGTLYPESLKFWSDKNKKSPYKYSPFSSQEVYWKCFDGKHEDYKRNISSSNIYDFRCPECQCSKGEERIGQYLINNNIDYIPQKEYNGLIGLGRGLLSYDFYLPKYNLLIEYQGEQHEKYIPGFHSSEKDFKKQREHDKRKREYAKQNNIKLLEIWYYDFDRIEQILDDYLNKLNINKPA